MEKPNVIIVVIDALRARNMSMYGYDKPTTPNIDKIAKDSVLFDNCFSTTNTTDPSVTTILSGQYPITHGILQHGEKVSKEEIKNAYKINFLQKILKQNGFYTIAIDWLGRWHKLGFDYYSGVLEDKRRRVQKVFSALKMEDILSKISHVVNKFKDDRSWYYDKASDVTNHAISVIEEHLDKNFFLFIHYWDTHTPYNPPKDFLEKFQEYDYYSEYHNIEEIFSRISNDNWRRYLKRWIGNAKSVEEILMRYDAEISYIDSEIGKLIEKLNDLNILDNTLLIITSDHGESLTEHGIFFDHHGLYDVNIHVPLIMRYPKRMPKNKRISFLVQHVDIVPTVLDLLNIEYTSLTFDGISLINSIEKNVNVRNFIFAEEFYVERKMAIRTNQYKYIFAPSEKDAICRYCGIIHGGVEELYDLREDPDERHNIIDKESEIALNLKLKLQEYIKELRNRRCLLDLKLKIKSLKR
ncbi:MAG: sulfatase [Candidatus Asgardarchaeum sp.]